MPQAKNPPKPKKLTPIDGLINGIVEEFKKNWQKLCLTSFLFVGLPQIAFFLLIPVLVIIFALVASATDQVIGIVIAIILIFVLLLLALVVITMLGNLSVLVLVKNPKLEIGQAVKQAWGMIFSYIWISILVGLIVTCGYLLFFIPGIIFAVWFFLAPYILFFEGKKGSQALGRSKELIDGYWWPVFGRIIIIALITTGISMVLMFIPLIGQLAMLALLMPIFNIFIFLLYKDLKRIKS